MQIRAALPCDPASIDTLLISSFAPITGRMSPEDAQTFAAALAVSHAKYAHKGVWFVAAAKEELVGCVAYFRPFSTQHPLFQGNSAHIQLLGVSPSQTRAGVGRLLMLHCLAQARANTADGLLLQTSELMPEARALYESLGFVMTKILPSVWGQPTYLYAKLLP